MPRPRSVSDDQIVKAVVAAIGKHGPAKLTLARVGDECGLSPAALIQRFGSKAGLLAAVAHAGADYADEAFDHVRAATPVEAVREALVAFAGDIRSRRQLVNHVAMLQLDLADSDLRRLAAKQARTVRRRIEALLDEAVTAGQLRADDTARLAATVHAVHNGALITWAVDGRGRLADWIRVHIDAVLTPYRTRVDG